MVPGYIVILIFIVIFYHVFSNGNNHFAATASAIRQVWSSGCRMSCQHSNYSELSGMSGMSGLQVTSPSVGNASNDDCVCDTCPCAMIENFLRTCRPATQMYSNVVDTLSYCCNNFILSITQIYNYAARILACNTSCQRPAQILATNEYSSSENFSFADQNKIKLLPKFVRSITGLTKKSSISFKEPMKSDSATELQVSGEKSSTDKGLSKAIESNAENANKKKYEKKKGSASDETLKPSEETASGSTSTPSSVCSKCIEKGKTCIRECPRAKK